MKDGRVTIKLSKEVKEKVERIREWTEHTEEKWSTQLIIIIIVV